MALGERDLLDVLVVVEAHQETAEGAVVEGEFDADADQLFGDGRGGDVGGVAVAIDVHHGLHEANAGDGRLGRGGPQLAKQDGVAAGIGATRVGDVYEGRAGGHAVVEAILVVLHGDLVSIVGVGVHPDGEGRPGEGVGGDGVGGGAPIAGQTDLVAEQFGCRFGVLLPHRGDLVGLLRLDALGEQPGQRDHAHDGGGHQQFDKGETFSASHHILYLQ